jgi:starvation-inducible DNA-binding protein
MDHLIAALNIAHANTFVMYFKAHSYHWNVEGIEFAQHHSFFNDLYDDLHDATDPLAERIRTLNQYAPISLSEVLTHTTIDEDAHKPSTARDMFSNLIVANNEVVDSLNKVLELATKENKQGIVNFVADRLDVHAKHGWMLRAHLKG